LAWPNRYGTDPRRINGLPPAERGEFNWDSAPGLQERIRSGIAAAKARGKRLGRQPGQRPKSDRLAPKVLALLATGRSYRLIARELGLSKNTVAEIVKRERAKQPKASPFKGPGSSRLG
jgi:hypothetical protein